MKYDTTEVINLMDVVLLCFYRSTNDQLNHRLI